MLGRIEGVAAMRAESGAGGGIVRTLSVALAALLAFSPASSLRAEEAAGPVIRKAAVDATEPPATSPDTKAETAAATPEATPETPASA
ncbi:hypothetical protein MZTS_02955, partial [Methylorubrum zatmanii]|nr:hypothetical protein [Methylorubrum zatmanii]